MLDNNLEANLMYVQSRQRELRAAADELRRVRMVRPPRRLRHQVGDFLIAAGERLAR